MVAAHLLQMTAPSSTPREAALELLRKYYDAFHSGDRTAFVSLVTGDVSHAINQGQVETGREAFRAFMERMDRCYSERLEDLVLFADESGTRAAAEFTVVGTYLADDDGLPPARGQTYRLPAGAFFSIRDGLISRVTVYYNLNDWIRQVSGPEG